MRTLRYYIKDSKILGISMFMFIKGIGNDVLLLIIYILYYEIIESTFFFFLNIIIERKSYLLPFPLLCNDNTQFTLYLYFIINMGILIIWLYIRVYIEPIFTAFALIIILYLC